MPSLEFDAEKIRFIEFYASQLPRLKSAEDSFRTLIASLLSGNSDFPTPVVTSRLKDRDECLRKFVTKYQTDLEEQQIAYEIKNHITDLVGVRVTCYYETDVPDIHKVLKENFEVIEVTDKTSNLEAQDNAFGYKGLHLDLKLSEQRKSLPEYARFADWRFEVQIRTIIQHAWSELDHKIKYKKSPPATLKRKINRLAALFELADQEFVNIRIETEERERKLSGEPTIAGRDSYTSYFNTLNNFVNDLLNKEEQFLDAFQFLSLVKDKFPTYHFLSDRVDEFVQRIRRSAPEFTQADLRKVFTEQLPQVKEYAEFQDTSHHFNLNPYTMLRHALYLSDKNMFASMLFDRQRANFEELLTSRESIT